MEYFAAILDGTPPAEIADIISAKEMLNVNIELPTKLEVNKDIKQIKSSKSSGPDDILLENLNIYTNVFT
jgi:hypothetical protein